MNPGDRVVLLVEDDADHAELVRRSFEEQGVEAEVFHLADGEEALSYLFRRGRWADATASPRPHLILLDLRLPKRDGLEVLREIKADSDLQSIPAVVLTTSQAHRDMERAYEARANSYVVKPDDFPEFSRMMDDLGAYWLGWNRRPAAGP